MRFRFLNFIIDVGKFCESKFHKIRVVWVQRINLFQYRVSFVKL